jgi:hypothetical protein
MAACRAGPHRVPGGAPREQPAPAQEVDRPAVAPRPRDRAAHHADRVAQQRMRVEPGRIAGREVDAAVAHVGDPLRAHGPGGAVHVVTAERELHGVVDQLVVVAGHPGAHAVAGRVHVHRAALGEGQVAAVRGVHPGTAGADRPVPGEPAVPPDLHVVGGRAGHRDQGITDPEVLGQVGPAVDARRALQAGQMRSEPHAGVRRPVVAGPEPHALAGHPVPRPGDRLTRPDPQRPLHRGPVGDGPAEIDHDGHAHADRLARAEHRGGGERTAGPQRAERARHDRAPAVGIGGRRGDPVGLRRGQGPAGAPAAGGRAVRPGQVLPGPGADGHRPHAHPGQPAVPDCHPHTQVRTQVHGPSRPLCGPETAAGRLDGTSLPDPAGCRTASR